MRTLHGLRVAAAGVALTLAGCGGGQAKEANSAVAESAGPSVAPAVATAGAAAPVTPAAPAAPLAAPVPGPASGTSVVVNVKVVPEVADSTHPTGFQTRRLVGHYSTLNGKVGFILDRTTDPARMRLDADPYVLDLTVRPSSRGTIEYVASNIWVRVDEESGSILLFAGPGMKDSSRVVRDADAKPLPARP